MFQLKETNVSAGVILCKYLRKAVFMFRKAMYFWCFYWRIHTNTGRKYEVTFPEICCFLVSVDVFRLLPDGNTRLRSGNMLLSCFRWSIQTVTRRKHKNPFRKYVVFLFPLTYSDCYWMETQEYVPKTCWFLAADEVSDWYWTETLEYVPKTCFFLASDQVFRPILDANKK